MFLFSIFFHEYLLKKKKSFASQEVTKKITINDNHRLSKLDNCYYMHEVCSLKLLMVIDICNL